MATYRIYKSLDESCTHLTLLGSGEGPSPRSVALAFFRDAEEDDVPKHLAIIAERGVHYLPAAVETQTRLRFG